MSRSARLFQDVEEVIESWYICLQAADIEGALSLWFDEDTVSCILPEGVRINGLNPLREGLKKFIKQPIHLDTLTSTSHTFMGTTFIDTTEAVRFKKDLLEPAFFMNMTMVLVQGSTGWRIAHMHMSPVPKELVQTPTHVGDHGFH
jgi:ketosteroid isomerase-like protein